MYLEVSCLLTTGCFLEGIAESCIAVLALHFLVDALDGLVPTRKFATTGLLTGLAFRLAGFTFSTTRCTTRLGHFFYLTHSKKMLMPGL